MLNHNPTSRLSGTAILMKHRKGHYTLFVDGRINEKRDEIIAALRKKGLRRLTRQILGTVADIVEQYAADKEISPQATKHPLVQRAVEAQSRLGWEAFFRGYLVREWQEALHATHNGDATQQFDQFQQLVWFEISQPQWYARNEVAHGPNTNTERIESARLAAMLGWYHRHRHELLPAEQQVLARRNLHDTQNIIHRHRCVLCCLQRQQNRLIQKGLR